MTLRVLCRGGLFCWENIKLNQFSVERCFLGRSRDQLLQRKLKFIRSRALLTIIHVCRDFQAIGDSIYYSLLMLWVFRSSQNDMIRSGTQKLYNYLPRTLFPCSCISLLSDANGRVLTPNFRAISQNQTQ